MKVAVFETEEWEHRACLRLEPENEVRCTPEPLDKSIDDALAPVVAMNYFDLENAIKTSSEKTKVFRKNLASNKILFMIDGLIDSQQQLNAKNIAPNYYCFDGNVDSMYSNI